MGFPFSLQSVYVCERKRVTMPKLYTLLGKQRSETIMNSKFAKLSRAPYGAYAAHKVGTTLDVIELFPQRQEEAAELSSTDGEKLKVWQLWLQGWADAPPMVSAARALNEKANPQLEFYYLNLDEACELVGLDPKIRKLYEQGAIKPSGMADLLRLLIVSQEGGIWLDATVATSPAFGKLLATSPNFFLISGRQWDKMAPRHHTVTNWAFGASPGNYFVKNWAHLQEQHSLRHGQLHHFDAFFCATALIKKGILPLSDLTRLESLQLFEGGSKLIETWLQDRRLDSGLETYLAHPLHKLTYKMGPGESEELVNFLQHVTNHLPQQK